MRDIKRKKREEELEARRELFYEEDEEELEDDWDDWDDWDDEDDDDDVDIDDGDNDIAEKKGWFGRFFSRAKNSFSDAFKDPNEDIDEDERW